MSMFSKKRKKGKGKNKGNEQVIDMSQFQNIGDDVETEKETKEEEKEKEKLGTLHFSLGTSESIVNCRRPPYCVRLHINFFRL